MFIIFFLSCFLVIAFIPKVFSISLKIFNRIPHFCLVNIFICSFVILSFLSIFYKKCLTNFELGFVIDWAIFVRIRNFKPWFSTANLVLAFILRYCNIVNYTVLILSIFFKFLKVIFVKKSLRFLEYYTL